MYFLLVKFWHTTQVLQVYMYTVLPRLGFGINNNNNNIIANSHTDIVQMCMKATVKLIKLFIAAKMLKRVKNPKVSLTNVTLKKL